MRFLRNVKGYTRLDKMRSETVRKELKISGIRDVESKYEQNWVNHLGRVDNTRIPKHTSRKNRSWTPQDEMAARRRRNRSNDLNPWKKKMTNNTGLSIGKNILYTKGKI
jgi:hypothetical protein